VHVLLSLLLPLIPLLPAVFALAFRGQDGPRAGRALRAGATLSLLVTLAAAGGWLVQAAGADRSVSVSVLWDTVLLRFDGIAAVTALLVGFVGWRVIRFSGHHLAGDPHQAGFFRWVGLTLASVLLLVLAGHLLVIWAAWVATSLSLQQLLLHFPERRGARFAARKKFVFSRLGDTALLGAILWLHHHYGTLELEPLFRAVAAQPEFAAVAGWLLVACAALKSAQFPFHSWLPDTMETPTPVSAFMHAGVVNAGGFLLIRMAPLLVHTPGALAAAALLGAFTAAFGAVVMLTQPGVKRSLAYSTIAQMGFMMLQCGLGAWGLALLHLVAHALYKSHAFLSAGATVGSPARAAVRLSVPALIAGAVTSALLVLAAYRVRPHAAPAESVLFVGIVGLALAYGLARVWSTRFTARVVAVSVASASLVAVAALELHLVAGQLLPGTSPGPGLAGQLIIGAVFAGLFLFQAVMWRLQHTAAGRALYVHALNGFYIGTWANRALDRLWPRQVRN
jgi:NAD(P)H-quinone oxidoreductase subunit 5